MHLVSATTLGNAIFFCKSNALPYHIWLLNTTQHIFFVAAFKPASYKSFSWSMMQNAGCFNCLRPCYLNCFIHGEREEVRCFNHQNHLPQQFSKSLLLNFKLLYLIEIVGHAFRSKLEAKMNNRILYLALKLPYLG